MRRKRGIARARCAGPEEEDTLNLSTVAHGVRENYELAIGFGESAGAAMCVDIAQTLARGMTPRSRTAFLALCGMKVLVSGTGGWHGDRVVPTFEIDA